MGTDIQDRNVELRKEIKLSKCKVGRKGCVRLKTSGRRRMRSSTQHVGEKRVKGRSEGESREGARQR